RAVAARPGAVPLRVPFADDDDGAFGGQAAQQVAELVNAGAVVGPADGAQAEGQHSQGVARPLDQVDRPLHVAPARGHVDAAAAARHGGLIAVLVAADQAGDLAGGVDLGEGPARLILLVFVEAGGAVADPGQ